MTAHCDELFRYAASRAKETDILDFAPMDPGYDNYVAEWTRILRTRTLPAEMSFDVSETIRLTQLDHPEKMRNPTRFRRFRVLTNSVELALAVRGIVDVFSSRTFLVNFIDDVRELGDTRLNGSLLQALDEFDAVIGQFGSDDLLFLLLGRILVRLLAQASMNDIPQLANHLITAESEVPKASSGEFLWGCTCFDQMHGVWKANVAALIPEDSSIPELALLRNALLVQP